MIYGFPPEDDSELQEIRRIRNLGRQWMTDNTQEISEEEQRAWWKRMQLVKSEDFLLYAYRTAIWGPIVGYGMVMRREGLLHISLAVSPEYRGRGYGSAIYSDMFNCASIDDESVYAVILKSNTASIKAAEKAGFRFVEDGDKTVLYVRSR